MENELRRWMRLVEVDNRDGIERIARQVRADLAAYYEDEPYWSVGECLEAAKELEQALVQAGYPAKRVGGYYNCCEDEYLEIVAQHSLDGLDADDDLSNWNNRWKHWWVRCGKVIIDITADQFHPSDPKSYEVVITKVGDPCYGRQR